MQHDIDRKRKIAKFSIVAMLLLLCFIFYKVTGTDEHYNLFSKGIDRFNSDWKLEYNNGESDIQKENVSLPLSINEYVSDNGLTIKGFIPEDWDTSKSLFVKSKNQSIEILIDGESINSYGILNNKAAYGVERPSGFLELPIIAEYRGKEITIKYNCDYLNHRTHIDEIYVGTEAEFIGYLLHNYGIDILGGVLFLLLGLVWLILYGVIYAIYKRSTDINYIGVFGIMMGLFMLLGCGGRQIYMDNIVFAEKLSYILLPCLCIPCLMFGSGRMKHRYKKTCNGMCILLALDAIICFIFDYVGFMDMSISVIASEILIVVAMLYAIIAIAYDCKVGHFKEIKDVIVGFAIIVTTVLFKYLTILFIDADNEYANIAVYVGTLILLVVMGRENLLVWIKIEGNKQEAEHASKAKSAFLANMSHEIRTPISAILGMDEMILRETSDDNIKNYAGNIRNAGNMLLSIVNDILDFSKIESGKMELVECEYEIVSLLNDVIIMMKKRAEDKGLSFNINVSSDLPVKLYGDDVRIRQIITNIISNAVKYTKTGSVTFEINCSDIKDDDGNLSTILHVRVEDTGIGIKEEDMGKLFDSFKRLDEKHNRNIEGTGLGMSITSYFLKLMKSELKVTSTYGKGSVFYFDLPQVVLDKSIIGEYEKAYLNYEKKKKIEHSGFEAPEAKILAVDDNEMNLEVLCGLLKETKMNITTATRGARAIELLKEHEYDLILLDHMMPGMDGIETLAKLREQEALQLENGTRKNKVPVVVLTANAITGAREMYLEAGFQDYLMKPIVSADLEKIIINYLPGQLIKQKSKIVEVKKAEPVADKNDNTEKAKNISDEYLRNYGINIDNGINFAAGKPGKYKIMLGAFVKFDPSRREKLEVAFNSGDAKNYAIEAHGLKSNARSIGANNLADIAYEHEKAGKAGDNEFIKNEYANLVEEMNVALKGVNKILSDDLLLEHTVNKADGADTVKETKKEASAVAKALTMKDIIASDKSETNDDTKIVIGNNKYRKEAAADIKEMVKQYDRKMALNKLNEWHLSEKNEAVVSAISKIEALLYDFEFEKALVEIGVLEVRIGA